MIFLTSYFLIILIAFSFYKASLDTFNGRSSESTIPLTNEKYFGKSPSKFSEIKTLLTNNLIAALVPLVLLNYLIIA